MSLKKIQLAAATLLLIISSTASADFEGMMNDMFGSLVNVTPPQSYDSQTRHVLAGGSIYLRNRISRPNLVNFQPPRLNAGCNGIDIYGGSFSFINKAQFEALLRNVLSNAAGYAFGLALEAMCPTCAQELKYLQKVINQINKAMGDSCAMAKAAVNTLGAPLKDWRDDRVKNARPGALQRAGLRDDFFEGWGENSQTELGGDQEVGTLTEINVVWSALQKQNVASWWASGDQNLLEVMMSVTGTVIKRELDDLGGNCDYGDGDEYCIVSKDSTLSFSDLYNGSRGGSDIAKLECDEPTQCLYPTETTLPSFVGFRQRVENVLFGDAATGLSLGNTGIVNKIRDKTATLTTDEIDFISVAPAPIWEMIRNAALSEGLAEQIANQMVDIIAIEMTLAYMSETAKQVYKVVREQEEEMGTTVLARIAEVKKDMNTKHEKVSAQMSNVNSYMANYDLLVRKVSERMRVDFAERRINTRTR